MDAATAVGQASLIAAPLPVQDRRAPPGTVEVRALENASPGSEAKPEGREGEFEPLAGLVKQAESDPATQAMPADTAAESGKPSDHVDTYA